MVSFLVRVMVLAPFPVVGGITSFRAVLGGREVIFIARVVLTAIVTVVASVGSTCPAPLVDLSPFLGTIIPPFLGLVGCSAGRVVTGLCLGSRSVILDCFGYHGCDLAFHVSHTGGGRSSDH